ncbi:MAG TPA: hypothetical protein VF489_02360 [Sphingobium sp.]
MKRRALVVVLLGASLCSGCDAARSDRAAAIKELGEHCHIIFQDTDIDRMEAERRNLHASHEDIIFLGTYGGGPPQNADCIDNFVSKSGYRFRYGINKPVL